MSYNLNEPNGSKRIFNEKGGRNEVKKHGSLFNDPEFR